MKKHLGHLRKMKATLSSPVEYAFVLDEQMVPLKDFFNQKITITFLGEIHCVQCGRKTNKSFQQGHCFPCMRKINECDNCIIHPERCHVEEGTCPEDDWAHSQCFQEHVVYLANTSGLKVGITRHTQVPTRWIDQGAMQALPIFKTMNRFQAGAIEVAMKPFVGDKTNWRTMLKQDSVPMDLVAERDRLLKEADNPIQQALNGFSVEGATPLNNESVVDIQFPVPKYPEKIKSLSLDKTPEVSGVLTGVKGQYLILDSGVINIRKFSGYAVDIKSGEKL